MEKSIFLSDTVEESVEVLIDSGIAAMENNIAAALEHFKKAEHLSPNNAAVQNNLAVAYWSLKNPEKAMEHATQAVRLQPGELPFLLNCGEILTALRKFGQAESLYKRFLKQYPDSPEVLRALTAVYDIQRTEYQERLKATNEQQYCLNLSAKYFDAKKEAIDSFVNFMKGEELPKYPLDIFLEVSNVCDLKCIMCATFSSINPKRHHNIAGTTRGFLDFSALQPMEELLKHALKVHCFGYGEPTINPNFREFIRYIGQYEVLVDFFTNGMHLTDDLVQFIVEHSVGDITVSFSGSTKVEYESAYQGGIFEQVLGGLARLRDRKKETGRKFPRMSINSLAYKHHLLKFDQFVTLMADHGVSVIYLKPLLECGNHLPDLVGQSALITPHIAETVIARAKKIAQERNIILSIAPELYVHNEQEEYSRHVDFSGLTKENYDRRKAPLSIERFKELAQTTKQLPVQEHGHWNVEPLDIEHGTEDEFRKILHVAGTPYAHGDGYDFYCIEPFKTMYVLENGQTKPCCNVPGDTPALGNVIELGGEAVWNGKGFATYRSAIMTDKYPLRGCEHCLRYKTGPKTHFVDQMVSEYFRWHSSIFAGEVPEHIASEITSLGDGSAIMQRFGTKTRTL